MLPIRTILCPTDFSSRSEYAFRLACALARDYSAHLVVLHVIEPAIVAYPMGPVMPPPPPADYKEKLWDAFRQLQASDPKIRELRLDIKMVEGDPKQVICGLAKETGSDLIVMGTHGRSGVGRLLLGSVAEEVLRKAPCPVLTVKMPTESLPAAEGQAKQTEKAAAV
jgi:nucleotide-binding universal stress UspA family protein